MWKNELNQLSEQYKKYRENREATCAASKIEQTPTKGKKTKK
jgi:hypothetical protein